MILILIIVTTFLCMEFVAWFAHKYIMHGLLWSLHKDHHTKENHEHVFEKNDYFFLLFATPGIVSLFIGNFFQITLLWGVGIGISLYGMAYFIIHDIFIHQRIKWFRNANNIYLRAIRKAHKIHHKHLCKEDGECFGMLIVPFKYLQEEYKLQRK